MRFSEDALLKEWKRRECLLELDCGCVVTRHDSSDLDERLRSRLRSWYAALLRDKDPSLLPSRNLAGEVNEATIDGAGRMHLRIPADGGRLLSVKLTGWTRSTERFLPPDHPEVRRSFFPAAGPTEDYPLAVLQGDMLILAPAPNMLGSAHDRIESLIMTALPQDGSYELHPSLLDELPAM